MKIGDEVRTKRFNRTGKIVEVQKSIGNKDIFIVQYTENESEGLYEWELELI